MMVRDRQLRARRRLGWFSFSFPRRKLLFRFLLISLATIAILPPLYFHFTLRRFHLLQSRKCSWMRIPPLVCAHGGDSTKAFPNTIALRLMCLVLQTEYCSLFTIGRDLQRILGNSSSKVGYLSEKEISDLVPSHQHSLKFHGVNVPKIEDALKVISGSVRQVILDAKVGPPLYEKGFAKDILSVVERSKCKNCIVWAKSDGLARDVIKLSSDTMVGYIVMKDPSTGRRMELLRMRGAGVVGVYHPLIDEKVVKILHGRNKKVYAWTVDEEESMRRMLSERVDGVVTSNPALLQGVMHDIRTQCIEEGFPMEF